MYTAETDVVLSLVIFKACLKLLAEWNGTAITTAGKLEEEFYPPTEPRIVFTDDLPQHLS